MIRGTIAVAALALAATAAAQDANEVIDNVAAAMGAGDLDSIVLTGDAADVNFLQTLSIRGPWPLRGITNYQHAIDVDGMASRATGETSNVPLFGGPSVPGEFSRNVQPGATGFSAQVEYWVTPWGFLRGASENDATAHMERVNGRNFTILTWSPEDRAPSGAAYQVRGYVNADDMLERVETWIEHDMLGDMHVEMLLTDYRTFDGVQVPTRMVQKRGGWPFFQIDVTDAETNPSNIAALTQPPQGRGRGGFGGGGGGGGGAGTPAPTQLAEGVYELNTAYRSLAVEFDDYIVVYEAGLNIALGEEIIAQVSELFPDKPIAYVVNSHPHSDHSSGLAPFVAIGATIVTHENNVSFFEDIFSQPRTLVGDRLARSYKEPKVMGFEEKFVFTDGNQTLELHHILDTDVSQVHSDGIVIALSPNAGVLFQADFTLPTEGQEANPYVTSLAEHVERNGLEFERYRAVHAAQVEQTKADLMAIVE